MAHQRGPTPVMSVKEPHTVSLKVLRLSRPSLSIQHPLPASTSPTGLSLAAASYAYPKSDFTNDPFILSPLLTLPPAFGSAYVGEIFSCTLCANNEVLPDSSSGKITSAVRIEAEMRVPSSPNPIKLTLEPQNVSAPETEAEENNESKGVDLAPGESLQKVINYDLKEEGSHILAVTVTYSETTATSGRLRTFRKLYQFVCKSCMVVRTKTGTLPSNKHRTWALEAQLENCSEEAITLDTVLLNTRDGFMSRSINWEVVDDEHPIEKPVLIPRDIHQVCFLIEEVGTPEPVHGKLVFGVLSLAWRGAMGNRGFLSTGTLSAQMN